MHSQKPVSCARFWITDLTIRGVIIFQLFNGKARARIIVV